MVYLQRRFPFLFRLTAFLALFAVLVPVATNLVHHPIVERSFIHICGTDTHQKSDGKGKISPDCPICKSLQMMSGGFVPPVSSFSFIPSYSVVEVFSSSYFVLNSSDYSKAQPRAPPLTA